MGKKPKKEMKWDDPGLLSVHRELEFLRAAGKARRKQRTQKYRSKKEQQKIQLRVRQRARLLDEAKRKESK